MTPTLARMVAAHAKGLKKPIRWFSIPQLFRYERQQRGRLREHFQFNCDLIGEPGPLGDAEIVALALDVMRAFGLGPTDVRVRLSDRRLLGGILSSLGLDGGTQALAHQALDKLGRSEYAGRRQALIDAGVADQAIGQIESLKDLRDLDGVMRQFPDAAPSAEPLQAMLDALGAMGLGDFIDLDLTIVRGLAYYTGPVFELFDAGKSLRAICGGGRYDNLLEALGGVDLPAVGFGMGDVVLADLLRDRGAAPAELVPIDVFIAAVTPDDLPHVLRLAHELRDANVRVEYALSAQPVGKQIGLADARQVRWAVVIGPDERAKGQVMLKDLRAKGQAAVSRGEVVGRLVKLRDEGRGS